MSPTARKAARPKAPAPSPTRATVEDITPEMASEWLDSNVHNRPLRQRRVNDLVGIIERGEWLLNGDAIRFAEDGSLLDGQHRLWAVMESGATVPSVVIRGLPSETQETMDMGARRTLADALTLRGETNAARLASTVNYWWRYENGYVRFPSQRPTIAQSMAVLEEHPTLRDATQAVSNIYRTLGWVPSVAASCYYEFQSIDQDAAEEFFQRLRTGEDLPKGSPILAFRRYLEQHRQGTAAGGPRASSLVTHALAIKAWNLHRAGLTTERLSWKATGTKAEAFPEATA
jgi:hypothetical protein